MHKRSPLENRLRLRGGIFSFNGYDYAGKRYTASTNVRHTCSGSKLCPGDNRKCPDWRSAFEAAQREERNRAVYPTNPTAEKAKGYKLAQALQLLKDHDDQVDAAPNTINFHKYRMGHLVRLFGAETLCEKFGEDDLSFVEAYARTRLDEDADRYTISRELVILSTALQLAKDKGHFLGNPKRVVIDGYKKQSELYKAGASWLEEVEWIDELVAQTSSNPDRHRVDRRDDILSIVNLGFRRRELLLICSQHVDVRKRELSIVLPERVVKRNRARGLKTPDSARRLPLNDLMVELFKRRLRVVEPGQPLFKEWGSGNRDLNANWVRARIALLERRRDKRERAELDARLPKTLTFNDLRRTFCSLMKNAGVLEQDCAALLGHADTAMVKAVYGKTKMETLSKAVAKLPEMHLPPQVLRVKGPSRRQRQKLRKGARAAALANGESVSKTVSVESVP